MTDLQILRISIASFITDTNTILYFLENNLKKIPNKQVIKTGTIQFQHYLDLYQAIQQSANQLQHNAHNDAIKTIIKQLPILSQADITVHENGTLDVLRYIIYPWGILAYYRKVKLLIEKLYKIQNLCNCIQ
ncbi:hypothetical protein ACFOW1_04575 [Parasediminibacterium paludis]|uniref:Uncharacterized protein n=1 Tax=Parasediminibacterium paludis TaxID=908966 RepID=A0ABV8PT10_9BACT